MKFLKVLTVIFAIVSFLALSSPVLADTIVGVSPPIIDLGNVTAGSSQLLKFYVISPTNDNLVINLTGVDGSINFYNRQAYQSSVYNASEQNTASWVQFVNNPVVLAPPTQNFPVSGVTVKGARDVTFILNVPTNSEPGYHVVAVSPTPVQPTGTSTGAVGVNIVTVTNINVIFNVPGSAIRSGNILDVVPGNYVDENNLQVNVIFRNTGTDSMWTRATNVDIYSKDGTKIASLQPALQFSVAGKVTTITTLVDTRTVPPGQYTVVANVSYTTGQASTVAAFSVYPRQQPVVSQPNAFNLPLWIIFIPIIAIIAIVIYRRRTWQGKR